MFIFLPFFNFGKLFLDISTLTTGKLNTITSSFIPGPGFPFSALYSKLPDELLGLYSDGVPACPPPIDSLYYFLMNIFVFCILTIYLDKVIPDGLIRFLFL